MANETQRSWPDFRGTAPGSGETAIRPVKIDPSISWNVKLGLGALREHLDGIMSAGDDYRHKLVMECIWMAEKISADADAAHQNADEARTYQEHIVPNPKAA